MTKALILVLVAVGLFGSLLWFFYIDCTVYSPQFDERRFSSIKIGMSEAQVTQILGPPLTVNHGYPDHFTKAVEYYDYTGRRVKGNYHRRRIGFDQDKRVATIVSEYYLD